MHVERTACIFTFQVEDKDINNFSIIFHQSEGQEKHLFVAVNLRAMNQVSIESKILKFMSITYLRIRFFFSLKPFQDIE